MDNLNGLDHVVMPVRDLDAAERRFARLGFRPTPRGRHSDNLGTANATVMFDDDTYFELLGVERATAHNASMRAALEEREGPVGLAFKTEDARAAAVEFAAAGLADGDAADFVRPVDLPGGAREAMFTTAHLTAAATPGALAFVCQHQTPEVVWRQDYLAQPNGCHGVVEVIGVAADLEGLAVAWRRVFGDRLRAGETAVTIEAGSAVLTFLTPAAYTRRFAGADAGGPGPRLAALRLATAETGTLARRLADGGIRHATGAAGTVVVPAAEACGTLLEFAPA